MRLGPGNRTDPPILLASSPRLAGIRDVPVGITEAGHGDVAAASLGYGLTLARDAGAQQTLQSAVLRLMTAGMPLCGFADEFVVAQNRRSASLA